MNRSSDTTSGGKQMGFKFVNHIDGFQSIYKELELFIKYLGVLIDQNLSWKYHIDSIVTKISKNVGLIAKLRHSVPRPILYL